MLFLFNKIFSNLKFISIKIHNKLLNNNPTLDEIEMEMEKTILSPNTTTLSKTSKNIYQTTYYLCYNIGFRLLFNDLIDNIEIESILINQDLNMEELRTKTEKATTNNPNLYSGILKWISGNCWLNSKITNCYIEKLTDIDNQIIDSINKTIELVEPMSKPIILFHGFETFSNYGEENFKIGYTFTFPGILSKTTCFRIAQCFAQSQNYFQPKYLVIYYPRGSKHVGLDIKPSKFDEYEYIGKTGETFVVKKIYKRFNGLRLETFYICDSLDYLD